MINATEARALLNAKREDVNTSSLFLAILERLDDLIRREIDRSASSVEVTNYQIAMYANHKLPRGYEGEDAETFWCSVVTKHLVENGFKVFAARGAGGFPHAGHWMISWE